jgi:hypothetical protein
LFKPVETGMANIRLIRENAKGNPLVFNQQLIHDLIKTFNPRTVRLSSVYPELIEGPMIRYLY